MFFFEGLTVNAYNLSEFITNQTSRVIKMSRCTNAFDLSIIDDQVRPSGLQFDSILKIII